MQKITVLDKWEVKDYVPKEGAVLIRLLDKEDGFFKNEHLYKDIKESFFYDIDDPNSNYAITEEEAEDLADFILKNKEANEFVVHCTYAQGRSPAVGMAIADFLGLEFNERMYPDMNKLVYNRVIEKLK